MSCYLIQMIGGLTMNGDMYDDDGEVVMKAFAWWIKFLMLTGTIGVISVIVLVVSFIIYLVV